MELAWKAQQGRDSLLERDSTQSLDTAQRLPGRGFGIPVCGSSRDPRSQNLHLGVGLAHSQYSCYQVILTKVVALVALRPRSSELEQLIAASGDPVGYQGCGKTKDFPGCISEPFICESCINTPGNCIHTYTNISEYAHTCIYTHPHISVYIHTHSYMNTHIHTYLNTYIYIPTNIHIHVRIYCTLHIHIHVNMHVYTHV